MIEEPEHNDCLGKTNRCCMVGASEQIEDTEEAPASRGDCTEDWHAQQPIVLDFGERVRIDS